MRGMVLVVEPKKCIGCRICEQWCTMTHHQAINPAKSRIKVTRDHVGQMDYPVVCYQCYDAPCINVCPVGALAKAEETEAVLVDTDKCIGCRKCLRACPHGAISMHPQERYVLICDLCSGKPQCVAKCPEQAIQFLARGKADRVYRSLIVENLAKEGE